jgi:hypothetical protein
MGAGRAAHRDGGRFNGAHCVVRRVVFDNMMDMTCM